ncbi:MAG TPA: hypothetical protein VKY74_01720, partial [Chloroflexia bacterium]|nr:hypothetical protein [Chloroflexia bacterium]
PPTPPAADGLPAWMSGPAGEPSPPAAPTPPAADDNGGFLSEAELPAWLRAMQNREAAQAAEAAAPPATPPAPTPVETGEDEIPAWLRALSGVEEEILPIEIASPSGGLAARPVRVIRARPPREGAVQVFERLLAPLPVVAPLPAAARSPMLARLIPDRLAHLLLLIVVVGMWLVNPLDPLGVSPPQTGDGAAFYNQITTLPVGKPVLLVYDWDASRYGEMHALSHAVTALLHRTSRPFATISTQPEGPGFALQTTAEVIAGADAINCDAVAKSAPNPWPGAYGTRYLHLGYRPGSEAGLAELVSLNILDVQPGDLVCNHAMNRAPLLNGAPTLHQFGAIVLLAGDEHPLHLWIEQVHTQIPSLPLLAALPESGRPAALPYLPPQNDQATVAQRSKTPLYSAVFGLAGAQELEARAIGSGPPDSAAQNLLGRRLHTESAGLFFLALVLLVGFVAGAYRWINRRSSSP